MSIGINGFGRIGRLVFRALWGRPGIDIVHVNDCAGDAAGFGKGLGDVGRAVVTHHLSALDTQAVEPGQCTAQEADRCALLLIGKHLDIGEPCGVIDGHVDPVVSDASRAALLPVVCDAVTNLAEAGQLLDVDVNQIAGPLPFVALNRRLWIKVSQPAQPQAVQRSGHGGEGSRQQPGDVSQVEPLMAQLNGALQMLRIEPPPLVAANTASIGQCGRTI